MYFYYEIEIPPSIAEIEAIQQKLQLGKGYAEFIDIGIPKGVQRLAKARIYYNEFILVPFNRDMWISGEDATIRIPLEIDLVSPPYNFIIRAYNLDDTFSHTLSFGVSIDTGGKIANNALDTLNTFVQVSEG